ncbi:MAG: signal peptidase I [Syntrophaceae bacterium]|nr:signal peptidase I [Syntrophaceae bacterium]
MEASRMVLNKKIRQFFLPSLTPAFLVRALAVALAAYLFFGYLCTPLLIHGQSMEPAYRNGGFNFCWRGRYLFSNPKRYEVVAVRFAGEKVMLLKRVVALEGEWVEFRDGKLFVNGREIDEPYVRYPCHWNLPPRRVERDCVYVVGDNRNMAIENHLLGQVSIRRIAGVPLW